MTWMSEQVSERYTSPDSWLLHLDKIKYLHTCFPHDLEYLRNEGTQFQKSAVRARKTKQFQHAKVW